MSPAPSGGSVGGRSEAGAEPDVPGLAPERTALAWTRSALSIAVGGALISRAWLSAHHDVLGVVVAIATVMVTLAVWRHGQQTYAKPGPVAGSPRRQSGALAGLTTATLIAALLAIIVTVTV